MGDNIVKIFILGSYGPSLINFRADSALVLHRPQRARHPVGAHEPGVRAGGLQVDHEPGPGAVADRHRRRPADPLGDQADGVLGLVPGQQLEDLGALDDAGRLQPGDDERGVPVAGQDEHGQPLERHGLVAGEPGELGPGRQQQDVDTQLGHAVPDPGGTLGQHDGRPWGRAQPVAAPAGEAAPAAPAASRAW